jgi:choline-sulfatase
MPPNIVFVIADQHRWDFVGYEDQHTLTPTLNRLAEEGTAFHRAYCNAPLCSPSRAAIASGRYGVNSGSFTNLHQLPPGTPSFVTQLRNAGYRTAAVGKTHMEIHAYDSDLTNEAHRQFMDSLGWDDIAEISANGMLKTGIRCAYTEFLRQHGVFEQVLAYYRQWHYFMDKTRTGDRDWVPHEWELPDKFQESEFVTRTALDWLAQRDRSQPFLLHVGYGAPHSPIEPNPRFLDLYREQDEPDPIDHPEPADWVAAGRRGYRAMISQVDDGVGRILAALAAEGELANTVVVYTADHGELAGDHGKFGKTSFFEASVHVPFIVAGPGIRSGQDSEALVELVDVGCTLCDLAGVPAHDLDQGRSLAPLLRGETDAHRETVYCEMGCDKMLVDGRHKLMWGDPALDRRQLGRLHLDKPVTVPASPGRLYDLAEDPMEQHNLIDDPEAAALRSEMLAKLLARVNENTQPLPNLSRGEYRPL